MTWWLWTLVWFLLVTGALGVLFLVARSLFRKGMALARELGSASERLAVVTEELQTLGGGRPVEELAVFADPAALRAERFAARRRGGRGGPVIGRTGNTARPRA